MQLQENGVDFLFHTNTETGKTDEIKGDEHVNVAFIKPSTVSPSVILCALICKTDGN